MPSFPVGAREADRLRALRESRALEPSGDGALDEITEAARRWFDAEICFLTLLDDDRCLFRAASGAARGEAPRDVSFCNYTILGDEVFVVEDLGRDPRFRDNPLVRGAPFLRFYAGAPIVYEPGLRLGSLCLLDPRPRRFSLGDRAELTVFAERARSAMMRQELRPPASPPGAA